MSGHGARTHWSSVEPASAAETQGGAVFSEREQWASCPDLHMPCTVLGQDCCDTCGTRSPLPRYHTEWESGSEVDPGKVRVRTLGTCFLF